MKNSSMSVKLPISAAFFPKNVKIWGHTQSIFLNEDAHIAYAELKKGGNSSRHHHRKAWNRFFVVKGILEITVYRNEQEENIRLNKGECIDIEPLLDHRMAAIEDCSIIEMYWTEDSSIVDPGDIERKDTGFYGKKKEEGGGGQTLCSDESERGVRGP